MRPAVVLVADRTLSGHYKMLFEGIFATMQTTHVPEFVMRHLVSPKMPVDRNGRVWSTVLGLRRIESSLLARTSLSESDVVCTTPEALPGLLGPWTKLIMVSSSDPLGEGMSNTTTTCFWKGELYTRHWTARMMEQLRRAKTEYGFHVIGGGAGAWQWARSPEVAREQGIDTIFEGYFEPQGPELVKNILAGDEVTGHLSEEATGSAFIEPICGASMLGIIELSRGCGKGCLFCTMARQRMEHLPEETILSDLETNVRNGITAVVSGSEDFFRYGSNGIKPNFERLQALLVRMQELRELSFMQIDHGNIATIGQLSDEQLTELRRLLTWRNRCDYLWVNMGIESANGHLVQANSPGKMAPFQPEDWEELTLEVADKMIRCGFFPVFSVILGLPGETINDIQRTIRLIKSLTDRRTVIFPIFYEPPMPRGRAASGRFSLSDMRPEHLELYTMCYEQNFKWVPRMFWDNQRAAGVSAAKRWLIRILGKTEVYSWRSAFRKVKRQIAARS